MREVSIDNDPAARVTIMSYGGPRAGKTRWAATWPRPLFLSDTTESGWTTIQNMNREAWFEPTVKPKIWAIEKAPDMMEAIVRAEPLIRAGQVLTLVVDSITFYSDLFFSTIEAAARNGNRAVDLRQLYGALGEHLRTLRIRLHQLPVNVLWLALEKSPGEDNPVGGPLLSGQAAQKFAAGCDYIMYHRSFQKTPTSALEFEIRTRRWGQYQAGGRDEGRLPDPLGYFMDSEDPEKPVFVPDCTYRTFAEQLQIPAPVLKPYTGTAPVAIASATPPVASATPPVASATPAKAPAPNGAPSSTTPPKNTGSRPAAGR